MIKSLYVLIQTIQLTSCKVVTIIRDISENLGYLEQEKKVLERKGDFEIKQIYVEMNS